MQTLRYKWTGFSSLREHVKVAKKTFVTSRIAGTAPRKRIGVKWKVLQEGIDGVLWPKLGPFSSTPSGIGYVGRFVAGVVIHSVECFGAPKLRASEASFEAFGGLLGAS